jgi:hypothetical protein
VISQRITRIALSGLVYAARAKPPGNERNEQSGSNRLKLIEAPPTGGKEFLVKVEFRNNAPVIVDEHGVFPSKVIVCPSCGGTGSTLIPGMRGHAYTQDQLDYLGDDFLAAMMGGDYDTVCDECRGYRVSATPIISGLSAKDRERLAQHYEALEQEYAMRREHEAELRMGA